MRRGAYLLAHVDLASTDPDHQRSVPVALALLASHLTIAHLRVAPTNPTRPLAALLATLRQVTASSPGTRLLLDILASVTEPLPTSIALLAAQASDNDAAALCKDGLLRLRAGRLSFAHDELHDELARRQTPDLRRQLHERLLPHLRAAPRHHGLAATLLVAIASTPSSRAVQHSTPAIHAEAAPLFISAGHHALAGRRFIEAARCFRDALATGVLTPAETQQVQLARGRALASACEPGPASDALRAATHGPDPHLTREATHRAARELLVAGRVDDGLALLGAALRHHGDSVERSTFGLLVGIGWRRLLHTVRANLTTRPTVAPTTADARDRVELHYTGAVGLGLVDGLRALAFQSRHLLSAAESGEPALLLRALMAERVFAASVGHGARTRLEALDRTIDEGLAARPAPELAGYDALSRGQAAFLCGDFVSALSHLHHAEWALTVDARNVGAGDLGAELQQLQVFRLWTHVWRGNLAAMAQDRARLEPDSTRHGRRALASALAVEGGVLLALARDELDEARRVADRALSAEPHRHSLTVAVFNAWAARIQVALYAGRGDEALALVTSMWPRLRSEGFLAVQVVRIEARLLQGRAALAAGDIDGARDAARRLAREGTTLATACAAFLDAALARRLASMPTSTQPSDATGALARASNLTRAAGLDLYTMALDQAARSTPHPTTLPCGTPLAAPERFVAMLWGDPQPA